MGVYETQPCERCGLLIGTLMYRQVSPGVAVHAVCPLDDAIGRLKVAVELLGSQPALPVHNSTLAVALDGVIEALKVIAGWWP